MLLDQLLRDLSEHLTDNVSIQRHEHCLTNRLYRLQTPKGSFALRVNNTIASSLGIDRVREQAILTLLQQEPWCLHPIASSTKYSLTPWLESEPINLVDQIDDLIRLFQKVHSSNLKTLDTPCLNINAQINLLMQQCSQLQADFRAIIVHFQNKYQAPNTLTLCHHDWHLGNIYQPNGELVLSDWEYAAPGDPLVDLACFIQGLSLNCELEAYVLHKLNVPKAALAGVHPLVEAMSILWYQVRYPNKNSMQSQAAFVSKWQPSLRSTV